MNRRHLWLWLECLSIFGVVPLLFAYRLLPTPTILLPLLLITAPAFLWLARRYGYSAKIFWVEDNRREAAYLPYLIMRFIASSFLLTMAAVLTIPQQLFDFPKSHTELWLLISVGYVIFSVYPQEILYRVFFFHRYQPILDSDRVLIAANVLLFGWLHVAFSSWTAMMLSLGGGWLFATTYHQTKSLRLVCLEHGLYGVLIFTLGFGRFFFYETHLQELLAR